MLNKYTFFFILLFLPFAVNAQDLELPRLSPKSHVSQIVGLTNIAIDYGRPRVKGRKVWGNLVPYKKLWRTGANEASIITVEDDVFINGQKLPAGKYSIFTIPQKKGHWIIKFNSKIELWGTKDYEQKYDVLELSVKPAKCAFTESLTYDFAEVLEKSCRLDIKWEKKSIPLNITVDVKKKAIDNIYAAIENTNHKNWMILTQGAEYCIRVQSNLDDAKKWIDEAIEVNKDQNYYPRWIEADYYALKKDYTSAISSAEKAIELGVKQKGNSFTYKKQLQNLIETWEKKM